MHSTQISPLFKIFMKISYFKKAKAESFIFEFR